MPPFIFFSFPLDGKLAKPKVYRKTKKRRVFRLAVISAVRIARKLTSFALFCSGYIIPVVCDEFVMMFFHFGYNVKPVWLNFSKKMLQKRKKSRIAPQYGIFYDLNQIFCSFLSHATSSLTVSAQGRVV